MHLIIQGFRISEPATLITDYVMGLLALAFALRLFAIHKVQWSAAFLFLAFSSFLGGTFHGFKLELSPNAAATIWKLTIQTALLCSAILLAAAACQLSPRYKKLFIGIAILKLLLFLWLSWRDPTFRFVLYDFLITFAFLAMSAWTRLKENPAYSKNMLVGITLFLIGGAIQFLSLSPHPWFNHNDLFHLIQIAANTFLYRAALHGSTPMRAEGARDVRSSGGAAVVS